MDENQNNCEQLKELLIERIRAFPCEGFIGNDGFLKILMADEISTEQSSVLASNGQIYQDYLPSSFKVNNLDSIMHIEKPRNWSYLHIYFILKDNNVSLLFWFNNDNENANHSSFDDSSVYILDREDLIFDMNDVANYGRYIDAFEDYYLNIAKYGNITTYITYPMSKINNNFIRYGSCFFLRGGRFYNGSVRPNLMLEILRINCNVPTISTGRFAHFDMGDLRP
ncbi:hypothetical protein LNP04_13550 [Chryseobacterium sp. C-71]|uniref:hypothetical protein n=1 Tax=Chryseobacterium sp. C-71 TaxID=2893882 RepID=UPI001E2D890E|nr:hypothetical protein [Chryseobacterium sp. C-71]UFH30999.1 hypothetical protein LNP04_13550 [Chryseobacterium sp. C-71]